MSESDVHELLSQGVSARRTEVLVKKYGVNFELDEKSRDELKQVGADDQLLVTIAVEHKK